MRTEFAVIFDVDGVLVNSVPAVVRALNRALKPYGVALADLQDYHHAHSLQMILETVARERGVHIDIDEFRPGLITDILKQLEQIKIDPALHSLIQDLLQHKVPLAVGSSASRPSIERKLTLLGLHEAFSAIVSGDDVAHHKPAPDVYLRAARLLNVEAGMCVVIEDNDVGIEAARRAGAHTIAFGKYNENPAAPFGGDIHVQDWSGVSYSTLEKLSSGKLAHE